MSTMLVPPIAASDGSAITSKGARMPVMSFPTEPKGTTALQLRTIGDSGEKVRTARLTAAGSHMNSGRGSLIAEFLVWMLSRSILVFNFCSTRPRNIVA